MTDQEQINALKAQVNCLRGSLRKLMNAHDCSIDDMHVIADTLNTTTEQCLAEVKAKAVEDVITEVTKQGSGMQINVAPYFYDYRVLKFINELKEHAKQLREQAKC